MVINQPSSSRCSSSPYPSAQAIPPGLSVLWPYVVNIGISADSWGPAPGKPEGSSQQGSSSSAHPPPSSYSLFPYHSAKPHASQVEDWSSSSQPQPQAPDNRSLKIYCQWPCTLSLLGRKFLHQTQSCLQQFLLLLIFSLAESCPTENCYGTIERPLRKIGWPQRLYLSQLNEF